MNEGVRAFQSADLRRCREILDSLPDWFGIPESNARYLAQLSPEASAVFELNSSILGFVSLNRYNPASAEIDVIAVDPENAALILVKSIAEP